MGWIKYSEEKPPMGVEVLAYNPNWVDEDFNPRGIRIGFQGDEDFTSSHWWANQDCYMTISHSECDDNPSFSEHTKNNIEPELWTSLDDLTNLLPNKKHDTSEFIKKFDELSSPEEVKLLTLKIGDCFTLNDRPYKIKDIYLEYAEPFCLTKYACQMKFDDYETDFFPSQEVSQISNDLFDVMEQVGDNE